MWTKQAICAYVAREAMSMLKRGIRINAICPGPTDTPLAQANKEMWLGFGSDYRAEVGIEAATSLEQAYPLVFLCSDAASAISGITVISDAGYLSAGITEVVPRGDPGRQVLPGDLRMELERERRGAVQILRINRPEARNAMNAAVIAGIGLGVEEADADPAVRAIVITGTGDRAFCAGMDLRGFAERADGAARGRWRRPGIVHEVHARGRAQARDRRGQCARPSRAASSCCWRAT